MLRTAPPSTCCPAASVASSGPPDAAAAAGAWERLRAQVAAQAGGLCSPLPAGPGVCWTCRGPADPGFARCFQCSMHAGSAPGLLADAVVPVSYAIKGGPHAGNLWRYKSRRPGAAPGAAPDTAQETVLDAGLDAPPGAAAAGSALLALLLVFLRDHGHCAWRAAGLGGATHVAAVPSTRGRPGPHPLHALLRGCLRLPQAGLTAAPSAAAGALSEPWQAGPMSPPDPLEPDGHVVDPARFTARGRLDGARVLLLDDTWTTGARAQSAAAAAKLAGARAVVIVVLGRHVNPADVAGQPFGRALNGRVFLAGWCAVPACQGLRPTPP